MSSFIYYIDIFLTFHYCVTIDSFLYYKINKTQKHGIALCLFYEVNTPVQFD